MNLEWMYTEEKVSWDALSHLYQVAPLGQKDPADLKISFANSMFKCFVYSEGSLIAAGRALADGRDCSYICDVAVHPDFQGQGLGKELVSKLIQLSTGHKKIILYAAVGKESFYKKLGFKRMTTAMAIFKDSNRALLDGALAED